MFKSLFNYIAGNNSKGLLDIFQTKKSILNLVFINLGTKIPMTVPVSRKNIDIDEESLEMEMSFYLNVEEPPEPKNPNLYISKREEISVYTR